MFTKITCDRSFIYTAVTWKVCIDRYCTFECTSHCLRCMFIRTACNNLFHDYYFISLAEEWCFLERVCSYSTFATGSPSLMLLPHLSSSVHLKWVLRGQFRTRVISQKNLQVLGKYLWVNTKFRARLGSCTCRKAVSTWCTTSWIVCISEAFLLASLLILQ